MRWRRIAANKDILVGRIWVAMSEKNYAISRLPDKNQKSGHEPSVSRRPLRPADVGHL